MEPGATLEDGDACLNARRPRGLVGVHWPVFFTYGKTGLHVDAPGVALASHRHARPPTPVLEAGADIQVGGVFPADLPDDAPLLVDKLLASGALMQDPIIQKVAAISCGIYNGTPVLDLDYAEVSNAETDANLILTGDGKFAEVQATAEGAAYDEEELLRLLRLARIGCAKIFAAQDAATGR